MRRTATRPHRRAKTGTASTLVKRMHLIRTGIISFIAVCVLAWRDGYPDEDEESVESEVGDEESEDVDSLDE